MDLLTRKEAAAYLRLSLRKLDALSSVGELRRVKLGEAQRARVLFRMEDLEAFIQANLSDGQSDIARRALKVVRPRNRDRPFRTG